ncbi:MAG: hypothetical protein H0U46_11335 [Actinobacteria bacterium]|nr:hypothetical protein [Actinomycetota bacterium]
MTTQPPDFDDLVGADLEPAERDRLHRMHELLVSAGPPPKLAAELGPAPHAATVHVLRRRRARLAALAASLAAVVFAVGYVAGARSDDPDTWDVVAMTGVGAAPGASASLEIFDLDDAGNWPMELKVEGLGPSVGGSTYELWLTKDGELAAACGAFAVDADGTAVVPLNAPYRFDDFDKWVVVEEGSETPLLTT